LFSGINNITQFHADQYSNTFVAIPYVGGAGAGWRMPLPSARSPTVNGVHLAVVVGPKGTDISQRGQIHTNDKGQVRVRFGWQRTVPAIANDPTTDPLETDRRAAWVRMSEGWAGRQCGAQFLPRVGDEVVVSFIDGDYHLHVGDPAGPFNGGHRYEEVEQDYHLHIKKQTNFSLDGDWNVSVGGKASISADTIVLKAVKSITLMVGNSIVVVQADGIYNEAAIHYEQCGADGQTANDAVLKPPKNPVHADNGAPKKAKGDS
jgi:Type VI secretion system/phage-baseplate injector OB domain